MIPPHLRVTVTDRGFTHQPPMNSTYGGTVRVYESSAADGAHVWLRVQEPSDLNRRDSRLQEVSAHLTTDDAWRLAEQLLELVLYHYQEADLPPDRAYDVTRRPGTTDELLLEES